MALLKLIALDEDDLKVVSAHVQDAVLKVADLDYRAREKRLVLGLNRFAWEKDARSGKGDERRRAVLHFDRVLKARLNGFDPARPDMVLSLLAITFTPGDAPAGVVELVFSGGAGIRLDVECLEARLADLGAAWEASSRPRHKD
jgi:hypothetical protein